MAENPSVNRSLKDKAMDHIDHALGRPIFPLRESYRNYFVTDKDGPQAQAFTLSPNWRLVRIRDDSAAFAVTDAGRAALVQHLQAMDEPWRAFSITFGGYSRIVSGKTPGKAKYSYFLDLRDVCPDLTFGEFVAGARVQEAA